MKRTSMVNLSIICGLLALCVMTLIAVYALEPETSTVLLFEDDLNILDETKWEHLVSKCEENGSQFHYSTSDRESGKAIWTYGIQLWGSSASSNLEILERFQNKTLRIMANAPWFVYNYILRADLGIPTVKEEIARFTFKYSSKLAVRPNPSASSLLDKPHHQRRLKRHANDSALKEADKGEKLRTARSVTRVTTCPPCIGSENGDIDCVPTAFQLTTRNLFAVQNGRLEVRAKLPKGRWTTYSIGMTPNGTHPTEEMRSNDLYSIQIINNGNENDVDEIRLSLGLDTNHTTVHRNISSEEFHVFEIEWTKNEITFKIDSQVILTNVTQFIDVRKRNNSKTSENLITSWTLQQPFSLSLGAEVEEKHFQNSNQTRSSGNSTPVGDILEVDYIRLFKIS